MVTNDKRTKIEDDEKAFQKRFFSDSHKWDYCERLGRLISRVNESRVNSAWNVTLE
jgi:hypothetical protein